MFDIGWSELLVVGIVALIVVGPRDLPKMFRTLGEFTGKARRMAREFQTAMNKAADDTGVGDIAGDLRNVTNPKKFGMDKIREATDGLTAWTPEDDTGGDPEKVKKRIADNAAKMAEERKLREASEAAELADEPDLVPDPAAPEPPTEDTKA